MNDQDKLYFELGAKDNVTPIIEKLLKDSEKLQENFDNFKKITIKDIALKSDGALAAIRKQIQDSLNAEPFTIRIAPDIDTAKVTDAARAIIEAQEKILNAASGATVEVGASTTDTSGHNQQNTQAAKDNAEAVQQQAKSYEELRAQVDAVLGSLEKNTATIVEERNAISLIDREMKVINKDVEKSGTMTDNQRKRLEQLTAAREQHKQALQTSEQTLRNDIRLAQAATGSMNELNQSLGRMRMAYRAMTEEQRNSDFGKELLLSIQKADAKIKELDATIGNHQRNVGNYLGRSYNGLNMSLQQIVRELPNASMGFGMFTLAISNNIPILADQIKMAREAAKAQKEMGQVTTPVWKQLLSSLFSWQTALILGVTLLTVYGKEIGEWAKSLFTGSRAAISAKDATEKLNEALEKNDGKFSDNAISIKRLASEWKGLKTEADKTAWIEANQSAFEAMGLSIRDVTSAERAFVEYTPAVIEALKARARGEAARELAKDKYKEAFLKREKARLERNNGVSWTDRMAGNMSQISTTGTGNFSANQRGASAEDVAKARHEQRVKRLNDEADTLEKEVNVYYDIAQLEEEKSKAELKRLGIYKERNKTAKEQLQAQKANLQAQLDILSETEAAGKKGEDLRNKIADVDKRLAVYSNTKTDKANRDAAKAAAAANREAIKTGEAAEKRAAILTRQAVEQQRAAIDTEHSTRQAEISAMEDSTEKVLLQIKLDEEKRLEAIRREYEDLKLKRIEEAKKLWDADSKNKGINFYESDTYKQAASDSGYTQAEKDNRRAREAEVIASTKRATEKQLAIETDALTEYLKRFGTYEEARLALALQYTEKIRKAREKGDIIGVATAEAEQKAEGARIDTAELKQRINWATVFDGFGIMLQKEVEASIKAMREYTQKDEFKALSIQEQKTFYDLIHSVEEKFGRGSLSDIDLKGLGAKIERYESATERLKEAQAEAKKATEKLIKAQEENTKAQKSGTSEEKANAQSEYQKALEEQQQATEAVNRAATEQAEAQYQVTDSATKLQAALSSVSGIFSAMASGSLSATWEEFTKLDKSLNNGKVTETIAKALAEAFGSNSDIVSLIIGAILNLLDIIKEQGIGGIIGGFVQSILDAVAGLLKNILTGKFVEQILSGITGGVGSILNAITFGGFSSWFDGNSDEMQETVDRLVKSNEALADRIERLTEKIGDSDSTNSESEEAYRNALAAEKEWLQNQREAIEANASAWTNKGYGFLGMGGKSSFNALAPGAGSYVWEDFNRVLKQNGIDKLLSGTTSLWSLTPEEMQLLRDFAPKAWRELFDTDGHRNPEDLVNDYIDRAGMLDQLTDELNEKLTGYTWDNFKGSFVDTLKDLTSTTENFADNIEDLLTNAILNSLVNEVYKDRIKALYEMISDAAGEGSEGGTAFTSGELQGIREANEALAADLINARNALVESGVLKETNSSGSSSRNTVMGQTITENTASLLSGYINAIRADTSANRQTLTQILGAVQSIQQMPDIAQAQLQQLQELAGHARLIAENTRQNAQYAADIKDQLRKFATGTEKLHIK